MAFMISSLILIVTLAWQTSFALTPRERARAGNCRNLIYSGNVAPSTPPHLLLRLDWKSRAAEQSKVEPVFDLEKLHFYFRETGSFFQNSVRKSRTDAGDPATRSREEQSLREIAALVKTFTVHHDEIQKRLAPEGLRGLLSDLRSELSERTLRYLSANGVHFNSYKDVFGNLSAHIVPEGRHRLNRRAEQILNDYNGLKIFFVPHFYHRAEYVADQNRLVLSAGDILGLQVKTTVLGHELRHAQNSFGSSRNLGRAVAHGNHLLPGEVNPYAFRQPYEENEMFSYTLRGLAQELLQKYKAGQLSEVVNLKEELLGVATVAVSVADRSSILTPILKAGLDSGAKMDWESRFRGNFQVGLREMKFARIFLFYGEIPFEYEFEISDPDLTMQEGVQDMRRKVRHMEQLNSNYAAQFAVAAQACEAIAHSQNPRETAALLEGLISVTRPHFWEEGHVISTTTEDLVRRFNAVVSDRWRRYVH